MLCVPLSAYWLASAWFPPGPGTILLVLVCLSALAGLMEAASRRKRRRQLRYLAGEWGMTYSAHDRLRVTSKVAHRLPIPGAADVHVTDVIYGAAGDVYRYIFTVEFTLGVVRGKRRQVRVGTFSEPRTRMEDHEPGFVVLAPEDLSLVKQYEKLAPPAKPAPAPQP